jgi:glucose-6-phosphate 1-dehydrogenase
VALKLRLANWRWAGMPFYLRTGKRLLRKLTQISIHLKPPPHLMFPVKKSLPVTAEYPDLSPAAR